MKKLLVILLLFFPVHGAWAMKIFQNLKRTDIEFFGIKTGDKIQKYKSDYKPEIIYDASSVVPSFNFNKIVSLSKKKVPKKNKHFQDYNVEVLPESNLIHTIKAKGYLDKNVSNEKNYICEGTVDEIAKTISNKYKIIKTRKSADEHNHRLINVTDTYKIYFKINNMSKTDYPFYQYSLNIGCYINNDQKKNKSGGHYYSYIAFEITDWYIYTKRFDERKRILKKFNEKFKKEIKNKNIDTKGFE